MKIKITNKKSGLPVGSIVDLCDMAANTLVSQGLAVAIDDVTKSNVDDDKKSNVDDDKKSDNSKKK